ncbi:MAG: alpha/beta hydrolase fold domain-containing protein [Ilumatobacteraceae bacterium]
MFVHGGYWQALGAADSWMPATESVASGTSFAAVDYTLAPAAPIGTIVEQCVRAVEVVVAELRPPSSRCRAAPPARTSPPSSLSARWCASTGCCCCRACSGWHHSCAPT